MKIQFDPNLNKLDPLAVLSPFREDLYERGKSGKIRVGYFKSLPTMPASPAIQRSVEIAV